MREARAIPPRGKAMRHASWFAFSLGNRILRFKTDGRKGLRFVNLDAQGESVFAGKQQIEGECRARVEHVQRQRARPYRVYCRECVKFPRKMRFFGIVALFGTAISG